ARMSRESASSHISAILTGIWPMIARARLEVPASVCDTNPPQPRVSDGIHKERCRNRPFWPHSKLPPTSGTAAVFSRWPQVLDGDAVAAGVLQVKRSAAAGDRRHAAGALEDDHAAARHGGPVDVLG